MAVRTCGKGHCGHVAGHAVTEPGIPEGLQLQVTHTGAEARSNGEKQVAWRRVRQKSDAKPLIPPIATSKG